MSELYTVYLAPKDREADLEHELKGHISERHGRLFLCKTPVSPVYWAQNIWYDARKISIESIGDAAKKLRAIQRNWALYPHDYHRRTALIEKKLPHVSAKPIVFPAPLPDAPLGSWCLLDKNLMLAAPTCSEPVPNGKYLFAEDRDIPPNRAYLKLWEVFTRTGIYPKPGEKAIDLGASPGGWSWVLHELGCDVISVDKAALDPKIANLPRITALQDSAFGLDPAKIGPIDWLCSDIICYPDRLYSLVEQWMDSGLVKNMVCTLKFQADTDFESIQRFASFSNARILYLYCNKHELTWIWRSEE
ncbi:MAG: SAM-dependent methyltransferase [Pseudomonadota bacterium]